ncbi:MAG: DUF4160 domain-containing protein [Victivallales bacterium]|nr:DUF4160 domain-containing protein [Victivallales bacterium]
MPVIARFYGIIIRMYFQQAEHTPPHIHALFGEDMAAVALETGMVWEGHLLPKAMSMVKKWIGIHQKALLQMWKTQKFEQLPPLE